MCSLLDAPVMTATHCIVRRSQRRAVLSLPAVTRKHRSLDTDMHSTIALCPHRNVYELSFASYTRTDAVFVAIATL